MDATTRASVLFIAVGVLVFALVWLREILAPFAIAVFLWLVMDGFANAIRRLAPQVPRLAAVAVAVIIIVAGVGVVVAVIVESAQSFASRGGVYLARLDELIARGYALIGRLEDEAPTVSELFAAADPARFIGDVAVALQRLASNAVFVLIYVGFLFAAQSSWPKKMRELFPEQESFRQARSVLNSIRESMERYLWVQTVVSVIISVLSYVTMRALGLENALFWTFLIFLLNYVPTVGSIVATILPTLFALVQYPDDQLWRALAVFILLTGWQFGIGNFVQPRMQGESLNLATIVVLLGLAVWGVIWGIPGMFLSSPLTVMVMIVLAQFHSTRWVAVLLSADGKPEAGLGREPRPDAAEAEPARSG